ncbi:hypothetical protein [Methanooceanicella nereidis]|uniref:hypothetical protein n=1 Tax=Methanooceanicella nereidis TaxID=2052831 RepID=UPI001E2E450E|nr:hypothetical protein [Methanocella sp. CWC-04]
MEKKLDCPCPKTQCERHGYCDVCKEFHIAKGSLAFCLRPKPSIIDKIKKFLGMS